MTRPDPRGCTETGVRRRRTAYAHTYHHYLIDCPELNGDGLQAKWRYQKMKELKDGSRGAWIRIARQIQLTN